MRRRTGEGSSKGRRLAILCLAVAGCFHGPSAPVPAPTLAKRPTVTTIQALTGAPQLDRSGRWVDVQPWPIAEFLQQEKGRMPTPFYAPVVQLPGGLSSAAIAGRQIALGSRDAGWVIDGDPVTGYRFFFDREGTGDLSTEKAWPLRKRRWEPGWTAVASAPGVTMDGAPIEIVFEVMVVPTSGATPLRVVINASDIRRGNLHLCGRDLQFAVETYGGYFGQASQRVAFDLNGDGTAALQPGGTEAFSLADPIATICGANYRVQVDSAARAITLTTTRRAPLPHPRVGAIVPDIRTRTLEGRRVRLAQLEGKYVLLSFWAISCAPCVAEIPAIEELIAASKGRLVVFGVTLDSDEPRYRERLRHLGVSWPMISEPGGEGPLHAMFDPEYYPYNVLISPRGELLCTDCKLGRVQKRIHR